MFRKLLVAAAFTFAILTGCGEKPLPSASTQKPGDKHDDHDHDGPGPHKGTIGEMSPWHIEFVVDHDTKEATIYVLGKDAKTAHPIKAEKAILDIKKPTFKVEMKAMPEKSDPAGKSSRFVVKDDRFGVKQEFAGEFTVTDSSDEAKKSNLVGEFEEKAEKK